MAEYDIFVSHSRADRAAVEAVVHEWEQWGHHVFVDFTDQALLEASRTGKMTPALAEHLRTTIQRCRVFVLMASRQSAGSGWMPWELGLAHGSVGRVHLYLLDPDAPEAAPGREYLRLYQPTSFGPGNARGYLDDAISRAAREFSTPAALEAGRLMGEAIARGEMGRQVTGAAEQGGATVQGMFAAPSALSSLWDPFGFWAFWLGRKR